MKQINKAQAYKHYIKGSTIHLLPSDEALESSFLTSLVLRPNDKETPLKRLFEREVNKLHDVLCNGSKAKRLKYYIK